MMKRISILATAAFLASCQQQAAVQPDPPADLDAGKAIAERECSGCHELNGRGAAPGIPHLAAQPQAYLQAALEAYREGRRTHAALRDIASHLSTEELRNVAAHFAAQPPLPPSSDHEYVTSYEQGERIAQACVECHGVAGNSTTPGVPSLAGQQPLYFIASTQAYLHGLRDMANMELALRGLSKTDIEKLALYYASQVPVAHEAPVFGDPLRGESLSAQCGGCHGAGGVSHDAATPSLAGQDPLYLLKATQAYRGHVRQHDVMFGARSDEELEDIAAYYAIQQPKAAEQEPLSAQTLSQSCDRCHDQAKDNPELAIPHLAGQDRDYLIMALRAYRDDNRESSMMHKMSLPYSDSMIESLATLYSARDPDTGSNGSGE